MVVGVRTRQVGWVGEGQWSGKGGVNRCGVLALTPRDKLELLLGYRAIGLRFQLDQIKIALIQLKPKPKL
jgi:hypothetical protein